MESYIHRFEPLWGTWKVGSILGEGSFGKVWEVRCEAAGETKYAAVKEVVVPVGGDLSPAWSEGMDLDGAKFYAKELLDATLEEFKLMQTIADCTNIVRFEECQVMVLDREDEFGWVVFMRMERLTSFTKFIHENSQTISSADVIKLGLDICNALEFCAERGIIHRDIKPENLFYCPHTNTYKLGDFGISHYLESPTEGKGRPGTLTHMPPEVFQGAEFTSVADLYALGMILYRMLNNNRIPFLPPYPKPFTPSQRDQAVVRRLRGEAPGLPQINNPADLSGIVQKAIAPNPEERFKSPAALREVLGNISAKKRITVETCNTWAEECEKEIMVSYREHLGGIYERKK